jgi:colicin import membrane protein
MTAFALETRNEKAVSGALALVMHLLFFALLVVGVAWQKHEPTAMVAELWSSLPEPKVAPPPPKAEPAPPKPQPKDQAKPVPKVEPKPAPKPDIALREKKEKARKEKERELAEKKKREELARQEALKQQQAKEAEALRLAREQDEALKKLAQIQAAAAAQAKLVDEYKRRIADRIRSRIVEPQGLRGNPEVEFDVVVLPGGEVLDAKIRKASGQSQWDAAVERAIRSAQPLPLPPPESGLMREFRELNLKFRPKE